MTQPEGPWEPPVGVDAGYAAFAKDHRVVVDDGTPIAYAHRNPAGAEVPLLFANGWSCSDVYWTKVVPPLEARGHPCLVPDTRGHGRSGLPRPPGRGARNLTIDDVSMARIAADLVAVLDDAAVPRAVVVGHSMGVQTALEVVRRAPERVAGLVLVAGSAENPAKTFYGTSVGDRLFPLGAAVVRVFPELLAPAWATIGPAALGHAAARLVRAAGPKATREDLAPYLRHLRSVDPSVAVLMAAAMREHHAVDVLDQIEAPTLVVAAGADVFTPARCSEAIHHRVRGSELVTFAGAGHTVPVEEPEALVAVIGDFLARRVPAPRPSRRRARPTA